MRKQEGWFGRRIKSKDSPSGTQNIFDGRSTTAKQGSYVNALELKAEQAGGSRVPPLCIWPAHVRAQKEDVTLEECSPAEDPRDTPPVQLPPR